LIPNHTDQDRGGGDASPCHNAPVSLCRQPSRPPFAPPRDRAGRRSPHLRAGPGRLADRNLPLSDQGRVLLIRRLALGRIAARASPQAVALQIERAAGHLASTAVAFASPLAASADVVVIPGRTEALMHLARLHARGIRPAEWFWPHLAPAWHPDASRAENWVHLLEAAHTLPESPIAAAAVVNEIVTAGKAEELLHAIPAPRAHQWLHRAGFQPDPSDTSFEATRFAVRRLSPRMAGVFRPFPNRFPLDDRSVWLGTLLAVHELPSRAGHPGLAMDLRRCLEPSFRSHTASSSVPSEATDARGRSIHHPARNRTKPWLVDEPGAGKSQSPSEDRFPSQTSVTRHDSSARLIAASAQPAIFPGGRNESEYPLEPGAGAAVEPGRGRPKESPETLGKTTTCAGLLFLVPILERLGIAPWLERHPRLLEAAFPAQLLLSLGRRGGLQDDDPLRLAIEEIAADKPLPPLTDWPAPVRDLLAVPRPRCTLGSPVATWSTAVRRWCRRNARMGLIGLIRRRGRFQSSRTHLEICFDLSQIDLRLRRLALDADPGWVPWLGRVIRFHYLDPDE
jgi:hypothetical protein